MGKHFQISAPSHNDWHSRHLTIEQEYASDLFARLVQSSLHQIGDCLSELGRDAYSKEDGHWNRFNELVDQTTDFAMEVTYLKILNNPMSTAT
jgi:hypothetical protein